MVKTPQCPSQAPLSLCAPLCLSSLAHALQPTSLSCEDAWMQHGMWHGSKCRPTCACVWQHARAWCVWQHGLPIQCVARVSSASHPCCLGTVAHALRDRNAGGASAAGGRGVGFDGRWRGRYRSEVGCGSRSHGHHQTPCQIPVSWPSLSKYLSLSLSKYQ